MRGTALVILFATSAFASGPFEKNHPLIDDGMSAYEKGDYETALKKFEEASKALPGNATAEFNRGAALHQLGRNDEAKEALLHSQDLDLKGELGGKVHYNLGNVWAAKGDKQAAIAEYRKALRKNPRDEMARHNLEVMLRDLPPPQNQGQDGGTPDGGQKDGGQPDSGTADAGRPDGGPKDGGDGDGGSPDGGADGGGDAGSADGGKGDGGQQNGDGGQADSGQGQGDGGAQNQGEDGGLSDAGAEPEEQNWRDGGADVSRQEAEKLLDSLKNSEKNLQLWRFQQKRQKKNNDKDW